MPNGIGETLGAIPSDISTGASSLWNALPSFGSPAAPTNGLSETSIAPSPDPNAGTTISTAAPTWSTPTGSTGTPNPTGASSTLPLGGATNPSFAGAPAPESTNAPSAGTPAAPAATNWGGDLKTGGTLLSAIATALQAYQRYNLSQNLQNPKYVAGQIQQLTQPLSAALKNSVGSGVQAQMQEAGLGEAPGLFRQALAQALAPYQLQQQQQAEQQYLQAINTSQSTENDEGSDLSSFTKALEGMYGS